MDITAKWSIPDDEFEWTFTRSSGPGGQNVNKVASKAQLHWNARQSPSIPPAVKARLFTLYGTRFTADGILVLQSQRFRDQERNRADCLEKLRAWLIEAMTPPRVRKKTRPSRASKLRRLDEKQRRSATKAKRRVPNSE